MKSIGIEKKMNEEGMLKRIKSMEKEDDYEEDNIEDDYEED